MEHNDNEHVLQKEPVKKANNFWLGFLIGLGGWVVHVIHPNGTYDGWNV